MGDLMGIDRSSGPPLRGRLNECKLLDDVLREVRDGHGQGLVLRGEPGVGKTALLGYLLERARGFDVARAAGVQSEMELPFAAVHQLCGPLLGRLDRLPGPQGAALTTAFGLEAGAPPDRFLIALAVLTLLADAAEDTPLLCVVDDTQWLDRASSQVLTFVARRLVAERVGMVFAVREEHAQELGGLRHVAVGALPDDDARALMDSVMHTPIDGQVRERIIAEARGNPLALLEFMRAVSPREMAGGFGFGVLEGNSTRAIEDAFRTRLDALQPDVRLLVLAAAAEPVGDPVLLWRAMASLGIPTDAAAAAEAAGLLTMGVHVTFRHPLVRSTVYQSASAEQRARVHWALAEATDPEADADRRAWHRAAAARGPDEGAAVDLERSAGRAQRRGGLAAAAAFLQRAVILTEGGSRRSERALRAASASLHAGAFDTALRSISVAEAGPLDELQLARLGLLRGQIAFASRAGGDAPPLLLEAAKRLEDFDERLARETYLDAWGAALFAGRLAAGGDLTEVSRRASAAPRPRGRPLPSDLLLDGLASLVTDGLAAAAPTLRRAASAFATGERPVEEHFRWGWLTTVPSNLLWDEETWDTINARQLEYTRRVGALARLPIDLTASAILAAWRGQMSAASAAIAEAAEMTKATETRIAPYGAMLLAALRGAETEATSLIDPAIRAATAAGQGFGAQYGHWVSAILFNGLGRHEKALSAALQASEDELGPLLGPWALPELIEASVRTGQPTLGGAAFDRLVESTSAAGTEWALGIEARCRALLSDGPAAEEAHREAVARLDNTLLRTELARAHLMYGEWLRRQDRVVEARRQLYLAHGLFVEIGMNAFAERTRAELIATGARVRRRATTVRDDFTQQEAQIARLVVDGLSNPEIGARLFLSPRTVEWHLRKVFARLQVSSRNELRAAWQERSALPTST